jgi:predicted PurR-regulated permease PerM
MPEIFKSRKFRALLPYFLIALASIVMFKVITEIGFFFNFLSHIWRIVTPFFYGFILAYIINIPFGGFQKLFGKVKLKFINKRKKSLSLIIVYMIFLFLFFLIPYLAVPYLTRIVSFFVANLPIYYERVLQYINHMNNLDFIDINISQERIIAILHDFFQNISIENLLSPINALFGVYSAIFTGFLAFISSIYILIEKEKIKMFSHRLLAAFTPVNICYTIMDYTGRLNRNFKRYIFTQTIDGCILGTIVIIQLLIMRSPYAIFLGIMLGIINYIPYFGSIIGSIIAIIVVAFTQGLTMGAIAAVVLLITQQIDGNIIQPKLMGGSFSLSPFLIIVSITVGGALAGIFGMIAAIPIVAVLKDILGSIISHREQLKAQAQETRQRETNQETEDLPS